MITQKTKGQIKTIVAEDPKVLLGILKEKEIDLEQTLNELRSLQKELPEVAKIIRKSIPHSIQIKLFRFVIIIQ